MISRAYTTVFIYDEREHEENSDFLGRARTLFMYSLANEWKSTTLVVRERRVRLARAWISRNVEKLSEKFRALENESARNARFSMSCWEICAEKKILGIDSRNVDFQI